MQGWLGGTRAEEPSRAGSWVDFFSLSQAKEPSHAVGQLCAAPAGAAGAVGTLQLLPGVDVLDLYGGSFKAELWKDGQAVPCWVPKALLGWEFYSLLWPRPGGTQQLRLTLTVDLMIGRPPRGKVCPSLVFAYVPANHFPSNVPATQPKKGTDQGSRSPLICERWSGNVDGSGKTLLARLVVLCPSVVYGDTAKLPDDRNWGLFIGPRSRSLVLLNKQLGRIDLNLATLLTIDAVFGLGQHFIDTIAHLFEPFGCGSQVPKLLAGKFDPMKVHSGLTNALVVDHVNVCLDGREDYWDVLGVRLPKFFLSNASSNLRFFTPSEAQHLRLGADPSAPLPPADPLPDLPQWTIAGPFAPECQHALQSYRVRMPVCKEMPDPTIGDSLLELLGFDSAMAGSSAWPFSTLSSCTEIAVGGAGDATPATASPCSWGSEGTVFPQEHFGSGRDPASVGARAAGLGPGGSAPVPSASASAGWTAAAPPSAAGSSAARTGNERTDVHGLVAGAPIEH